MLDSQAFQRFHVIFEVLQCWPIDRDFRDRNSWKATRDIAARRTAEGSVSLPASKSRQANSTSASRGFNPASRSASSGMTTGMNRPLALGLLLVPIHPYFICESF